MGQGKRIKDSELVLVIKERKAQKENENYLPFQQTSKNHFFTN